VKLNIRIIYLYLITFVGLLVAVVGVVRLVDLALKVVVFKGADQYEVYVPTKVDGEEIVGQNDAEERQLRETTRQRQRELSGSLAMVVVGLPLYLYHWKTIQKENKK
jgi:hypothetical protein